MMEGCYVHRSQFILISSSRKPSHVFHQKGLLILCGVLYWPPWHRLTIGGCSTTARLKPAGVKCEQKANGARIRPQSSLNLSSPKCCKVAPERTADSQLSFQSSEDRGFRSGFSGLGLQGITLRRKINFSYHFTVLYAIKGHLSLTGSSF